MIHVRVTPGISCFKEKVIGKVMNTEINNNQRCGKNIREPSWKLFQESLLEEGFRGMFSCAVDWLCLPCRIMLCPSPAFFFNFNIAVP